MKNSCALSLEVAIYFLAHKTGSYTERTKVNAVEPARGSKNLFDSSRFRLIEIYISGGSILLPHAPREQWV